MDLLSISLLSSLLIIYLLKIKNTNIQAFIYLTAIGTIFYWKNTKNLLPYSIYLFNGNCIIIICIL